MNLDEALPRKLGIKDGQGMVLANAASAPRTESMNPIMDAGGAMERLSSLERPAVGRRRRPISAAAEALAFAAFLVVYGNAVSAFPEGVHEDYAWAFVLVGLAAMLLAIVWALRWAGLSLKDIGITRVGAQRGALIGLGVAALVILPVVIYFAFPIGVSQGSIEYEGAEDLTLGSFLLWALVRQPIGVSLFEETMFRGLLQGLSLRAYGMVKGILLSAVAFGLWHLVINFQTVRDTNVGDSIGLAVAAQLASMLGLILGGLFMSVLRQRSGSLAAPIAFHWLVVVAMQGSLFALSG